VCVCIGDVIFFSFTFVYSCAFYTGTKERDLVGMEEEEEKEVVVEGGEGGSFEEKSEIIYLFCVEGYLKNN